MFCHVILGFLRDGRARHAYELISHYRPFAPRPVNAGNVYRECSKLLAERLIVADTNPADADPRRIPYLITDNGCREFDSWLVEPGPADLSSWMIFADMLPTADRLRLVDQIHEQLWVQHATLTKAHETVMARGRRMGGARYRPAALALVRRMRQATADLEFLDELRWELEQAPAAPVLVSATFNGRAADHAFRPPANGSPGARVAQGWRAS